MTRSLATTGLTPRQPLAGNAGVTGSAAKALHSAVIDYFALALTHALILLALVRIVGRADLDHEEDLDDGPKALRKRTDTADGARGDA